MVNQDGKKSRTAGLIYKEINEWFVAIQLQHDRIDKERQRGKAGTFTSDTRFYFMAWNVLDLVAETAYELTHDDSIQRAKMPLVASRPDLKDVRDVLSHISDYITQTGWLQTGKHNSTILFTGMPTFHIPRETENADSPIIVIMNAGQPSHTEIDIGETTSQARKIYEAVRASLLKQHPTLTDVLA